MTRTATPALPCAWRNLLGNYAAVRRPRSTVQRSLPCARLGCRAAPRCRAPAWCRAGILCRPSSRLSHGTGRAPLPSASPKPARQCDSQVPCGFPLPSVLPPLSRHSPYRFAVRQPLNRTAVTLQVTQAGGPAMPRFPGAPPLPSVTARQCLPYVLCRA